ncbi:MAG: hypothetical protein GVY19_03475 [Bacteroidetes bacterium]|jgi:uncharacterized spore protein YtfJ|nr:hypothetical protein [Bacteroidota bacterium]
MWLLIIVGILLIFLLAFLLVPLELIVHTDANYYKIRNRILFSIQYKPDGDVGYLWVRVLFLWFKLRPMKWLTRTSKKSTKKPKPKNENVEKPQKSKHRKPVIKIGIGFGSGSEEGEQTTKNAGKGKGTGAGAGVGIAPVGFLVAKGDELSFVPAGGKKGLDTIFEKVPDLMEKMMEMKEKKMSKEG